MTDDKKLVTVKISAKALRTAHDIFRITGTVGLTDGQAVEGLISAHRQEFEAMAAALAAKGAGPVVKN